MKLSGRGGRPSEAGADGGMGRSTIAGAFAVTAGRDPARAEKWDVTPARRAISVTVQSFAMYSLIARSLTCKRVGLR